MKIGKIQLAMTKKDNEVDPDTIPEDPVENYTEEDAEISNNKRMSDDGDGWIIE